MDGIKRRILELIDQDRVRPRRHFWIAAAEDRILLEDALRVARRGAVLLDADTDAHFGARYRIRGTDSRDRMLDVIVSIDEPANVLWLHTVFVADRKKKGNR